MLPHGVVEGLNDVHEALATVSSIEYTFSR